MSADERAWDAAAELHAAASEALASDRIVEAEALAQRAFDQLCLVLGVMHPDTGNAAVTLAEVFLGQGRFAGALELLGLAVRSCGPWIGEPQVDPIRRRARLLQADALMRLARYAEAHAILVDLGGELGPGQPERLAVDNALGVVLRFQGRYAEAEAHYLAALAAVPATDPARTVLLHNLAGVAAARGDFAAAADCSRLALASHTNVRSRQYAIDLAGFADALAGLGDHGAAASRYEEALALLGALNPDDPEIAYAVHNLGDALVAAGRPGAAATAYADSLARKARIFGDGHPEIAGTLNNLAALHADLGELAEARRLSARAVAMVAGLAAEHPIRAGVVAFAAALAVSP